MPWTLKLASTCNALIISVIEENDAFMHLEKNSLSKFCIATDKLLCPIYAYVLFAWYSAPIYFWVNPCTLAQPSKSSKIIMFLPCSYHTSLLLCGCTASWQLVCKDWLTYQVNIYKCLYNLECCFEFLWTVVDMTIIFLALYPIIHAHYIWISL